MSRLVVLGVLMFILAGTACGKNKGGNGGNPRNVQKGSGKACPEIAGTYKCSDDSSTTFRSGQNEKGQPIVNLQSEQDYITDGQIYEYEEDGVTVRYSVDCQEDSLGLHMVAANGAWIKGKITRLSEDRIRMQGSGQDADGQAFPSEDLYCDRK